MKTLLSIATLGLASVGLAGPAAAAPGFHFEPEGATFTAKGGVTVTAGAVSLPCTAHLDGRINALGDAKITSASFSGLSCAGLTASNLPWPMHAANVNKFNIKRVTVSAAVLGVCGPGKVLATLTTVGSRIVISGADLPGLVPCSLTADLQAKPHLRIRDK